MIYSECVVLNSECIKVYSECIMVHLECIKVYSECVVLYSECINSQILNGLYLATDMAYKSILGFVMVAVVCNKPKRVFCLKRNTLFCL
jgi:hypothetical protein